MMNRKIALSALSIVMALGLSVGGTLAFFTDTATSEENTFTAGTLDINIDQTDQGVLNPIIDNLAPGGETTVLFDVVNNGTLPVNLRGFALGNWVSGVDEDITSPDATLVKVTKVEYINDSGAWEEIESDQNGLTGQFYYSTNGNNSGLHVLDPEETEDFRLTVELDDSTPNGYQGASYEATVSVEAKQVDAPWETI